MHSVCISNWKVKCITWLLSLKDMVTVKRLYMMFSCDMTLWYDTKPEMAVFIPRM